MALNKQHPLYQEDLNYVLNGIDYSRFSGKRFLITGATGLIGVFLIDTLMLANKKGAKIFIYAVGRDKTRASARLGEYYDNPYFNFIEQDVRHSLPSSLEIDYIVPLASNTHPLAYSLFPIETIEINVKGVEYALKKAIECNATVLYPSSVEVYGNARGFDTFMEDYTGQLNLSTSRSCYTESKRVSEALCQSYISERGAQVKIVRLSRVFGPTMLMSDSKASSQFILNALQGKDIVLKSDGEQMFSYTYVADAVCAMLYVLLYGENGVPYNISNSKCNICLKEFAFICAEHNGRSVVFDLPSEIEKKGFSVARVAILDNKRLIDLGFKPYFTIRDAIHRTIEIIGK